MISALTACMITVIMNNMNEIASGQKMPSLLANIIYVFWGVSVLGSTLVFFLEIVFKYFVGRKYE